MSSLKELMHMSGRRVLITGATGALGSIIAETLAELGADLLLVDQPSSDFEKLKSTLLGRWQVDIQSLSCDLEIEEDRLSLINQVKQHGYGLNSLINNAAFTGNSDLKGWCAPFEKQNLNSWRRAMEVNLTAAFHLSQAFTPELRVGEGGNIINITSIYGQFGPDWGLYQDTAMANPAAYGASKGGLAQLTRWLATTIAPDVRVNAIAPGGIFRDQPQDFVGRYEERTPLNRMATEDDFRGAIAYLASDLSKYMTGQILHIDGGWGAW